MKIHIFDRSTKDEFMQSLAPLLEQKLSKITVDDDELKIVTYTHRFVIRDNHQCCEMRYFDTDDILDEYLNAVILGFQLKYGETTHSHDSDDMQEIAFFEIMTSKGVMTFNMYNNHNGYYGGIYPYVFTREEI